MNCDYERYLEMGGVSGQITRARRAELLRLHQPHHVKCGAAGRAMADPDWWGRERLRLHRETMERDAAERRKGRAR